MLVRAIVLFTYLCAVCALPLPVADTCQRCLIFHPFHQDKIAYCQAQNLCPIHDDAAASNITLKIDPPAVPFNNSLSTVDFSLNFTVVNATGTGQVAVKIFPPLDQFGKPMGEPKWLGGSVTEGFAVGSHVGVGTRLLYASLDCWFCNNSLPLPVGAYVVQGYVCNGYCKDLDDEIVPPHTRSLALFAEKAFSVLPQ